MDALCEGGVSPLCSYIDTVISHTSSDIKSVPFRKLQEHGSMDRNSNTLATFLVFLIRNVDHPIPHFPIILHQTSKDALMVLKDRAKEEPPQGGAENYNSQLMLAVHNAVWSFLSHPSKDFLANRQFCPLLRFFVASHILDEYGTLGSILQVTPRISRVQWCFRATGCNVVILSKHEFENDEFKYVGLLLTYSLDSNLFIEHIRL